MSPGQRLERLAFRLIRPAYYRFRFGHAGAAGPLDRWVAAGERRFGVGDAPVAAGEWEEQYRSGRWDYLHGGDEAARYEAIAGLLRRLRPGGSVLDVGCGEGILRDWLRPSGYAAYVGVDISPTALAAARRGAGANDRFVLADAESYEPEGAFDAIVLNEVVYYFADPLAAAQRYARRLAAGGVLVVSSFDSSRTRAIARRLARLLPRREEVRLRQPRGGWTVAVHQAAPRADAED
jgi:SAM-dependent methyltransferase